MSPALAVREPRADYGTALPPESVLSELWAGQRLPEPALVTIAGQRVRVLHPGIAGRGAGPDFQHARLELEPGLVRFGDVELHVRATDFRAHGHHEDARYDSVILHVVFEDDIGADTLLSNGTRVPVIALAPLARERSEELAGWLERPRVWSEPCRHAVERLGPERVLEEVDALGDARFATRQAELTPNIKELGAGRALFEALLRAAPTGSPELVFVLEREEAWLAVKAALGSALGLEAVLLGAAGLLPPLDEAAHEHERALVEAWRAADLSSPQPATAPAAQRPANHPARRLAGVARLLARHRAQLSDDASGLLPAEIFQVEEWMAGSDGYWHTHAAPGRPTVRPPGALIGRGRAIEVLVNAVLPWAGALASLRDDHLLGQRVRRAYRELPHPERYGRLRFVERNLWGEDERLPLTARRQQGLLYLYKTECTRGGCGSCLFS